MDPPRIEIPVYISRDFTPCFLKQSDYLQRVLHLTGVDGLTYEHFIARLQ